MTKQHLARWGGALALAVCLIRPVRAGECVPSGAELDVLTLNTWGLPTPVAWDRRGRMPDIAQLVTDDAPDVVGLQEVWRGALHLLDLDLVRPDLAGDSGLAAQSEEGSRREDRLRRGQRQRPPQAKGRARHADRPAGRRTELDRGDAPSGERQRRGRADPRRSGGHPAARNLRRAGPRRVDGGLQFLRGKCAGPALRGAPSGRGLGGLHGRGGNGERFDRILVRASDSRCLAPERVEVLHPRTRLSDHQPVRASLRVGERAPE